MCLFPYQNSNFTGVAYRKGLTHFECGVCPECLRKRANSWALRAVYEAKCHAFNSMVCLTYDQYVHDPRTGKIVGERVSDLKCNKRDVQLFHKRLRKWYYSRYPFSNKYVETKFKYLCAAEYGSRTGRAHYHDLLFGIDFPDCIPYKRSKRGHMIYRSPTLEKLWKHGICTVDARCVTSAAARYCTKYTAKTRAEGTFMLFSHGIGISSLITDFNAKSYIVEGKEYPIPRAVWQFIILNRYRNHGEFTYKYRNSPKDIARCFDPLCVENDFLRARYRAFRDRDVLYRFYLKYWREKSELIKRTQKSVFQRILDLPDDKYHFYKGQALRALAERSLDVDFPSPGSSDRKIESYRWKRFNRFICRISPCHNTANDTFLNPLAVYGHNPFDCSEKFLRFKPKILQLSLDF
ncbi:replication initiator protein [Sigmofec virus UA08Rod_5397]|uniref:Replication initiator protein n=1 Tax=Sigmofec virus UA08Rod_5397 TaxID=2929423 RepID=A0A976R5A5_9VIRU|nr:replication initiator protein [Sigmofec virus UA08Rod_5397]